MKILIFLVLLVSTGLSHAQESIEAECEFSFLKVDGSIAGLPQSKLPYALTLQKIPSFPFQQKYGASLDAELKLTDNESLKLKVYLTLIQGASLWYSAPKDRLQIEIGLLNSKDQVIGTFREHTDRVVRDYQLLEIEKNKPRLQLALPVGMSWQKIYSNPTTAQLAIEQGMAPAIEKGLSLKVLEGYEVQDMGVHCQTKQ